MTLEALLKLGVAEETASAVLSSIEDELTAQKAQHEAQLTQLRLNNSIDAAIAAAGAKNVRAVKGLLDTGSFSLGDDGTVSGLAEQLAAIRESDPYLFREKERPVFKGYQPAAAADGAAGGADVNSMTYSQLSAFMISAPDFKL